MEIGLSNPLNYTGGKHRYLKDMFEILPLDKEGLFVCDMFYGGGDLSSHLPKTWLTDAYEINKPLLAIHKQINSGKLTLSMVEDVIARAGLDKTNSKNFEKLKAVYNWTKDDALLLYVLICHSNTNRLRFNGKGEFNVQFGKRTFNDNMKKKFVDYQNRLSERDIVFSSRSSLHCDLKQYSLLLIDPPYLNTVACYNEKGGWKVEDELLLHEKVKEASDKGVKFVYFGQFISNGTENPYLKDFSKDYNVKILKDTTEHCSSNRKKKGVTVEVMIYN